MSLQAECMRFFCSVPTGGMPDDGDFLQCGSKGAAVFKTACMMQEKQLDSVAPSSSKSFQVLVGL